MEKFVKLYGCRKDDLTLGNGEKTEAQNSKTEKQMRKLKKIMKILGIENDTYLMTALERIGQRCVTAFISINYWMITANQLDTTM